MTVNYKGKVNQATPGSSILIWRKPKEHFENDLKYSKISEIDAKLDTTRFHICMPIVGKETFSVEGKHFELNPKEYAIFNPDQSVKAEGIFKKAVEGFCFFLTSETLDEAAWVNNIPIEKTLDSSYDFNWQQQAFTIKNYNLKENEFGAYLLKIQSKLLACTSDLLMDWEEFYLELAIAFLKTHQQIGGHLDAIPSSRLETKQEIYKRLSRAYSYILENFENPISLEDLEKIALLSKYYIIRLYRQIYGVTPYQHVLLLRIEKAKKMLQLNYSPTDIAFMLSFSDRRAFTKSFKKITGISPSEFQEKLLN